MILNRTHLACGFARITFCYEGKPVFVGVDILERVFEQPAGYKSMMNGTNWSNLICARMIFVEESYVLSTDF